MPKFKKGDLGKVLKKAARAKRYWKCSHCGWHNPMYQTICWRCGQEKQRGTKG